MVAVAAIPLVPFVYRWLYPPTAVRVEKNILGVASFALDLLGAMGDGILIMVWMAGFAAVAVLASLTAFIAAWLTREPRRTKLLCGLPALLVAIIYGVLVAIGA